MTLKNAAAHVHIIAYVLVWTSLNEALVYVNKYIFLYSEMNQGLKESLD